MAPRRPPPMDGSSGPETKVHRGTATKARLHCFVRLICLPLRSILRLRSCFFAERGRSRSPEVHLTAGTHRVFWRFSELWQFSVSSPFSPQPVTRAVGLPEVFHLIKTFLISSLVILLVACTPQPAAPTAT